jgi:hypothetical protein
MRKPGSNRNCLSERTSEVAKCFFVMLAVPWAVSCTNSAGGADPTSAGSGGLGGGLSDAGAGGRAGSLSDAGAAAGGMPGDAGNAGVNTISGLWPFVLHDSNCLPMQTILPSSDGGPAAGCEMLFTGVAGGCSRPGLSPASASDIANVVAKGSSMGETVASPVCVLGQAVAASGAACSAEGAPGWCYVQGACGSEVCPSNHSFCMTAGFDAAKLVYQNPPWLLCR